jgi:hypothetical protein
VSICCDKVKEDGHTTANEMRPGTLHSHTKSSGMREKITGDAYTTMAATMRSQLSHQRGKIWCLTCIDAIPDENLVNGIRSDKKIIRRALSFSQYDPSYRLEPVLDLRR